MIAVLERLLASLIKPLFGLNFGTATAEDAAALVEYCNVLKGTKWSELRRSHGV
jgi:alpha-N-arabinofuranosidase